MRNEAPSMKRTYVATTIVGAVLLLSNQVFAEEDNPGKQELHARAVAESLVPVRPGLPAEKHFWNRYSERFIYAPAFDIDADPRRQVRYYRFTVHSEDNPKDYVFEARYPWASLAPIWKDLPPGNWHLKVESLGGKGGEPLREVGERDFFRASVFKGPYGRPVRPYTASGRWALEFQLKQEHYQAWKKGKPGDYLLNCYPARMFGSVIKGMARYAQLTPRPEDADEALEVAENCARYLIKTSQPAGSAFEYFPPNYDDNHPTAKARAHWWKKNAMGKIMVGFPAEVGSAYLDLYDATGKKDYLDAAKRIADTYKKHQLPSGSWYLKAHLDTGEPVAPNILIPSRTIILLDRLVDQYEERQYSDALVRALRWTLDNPCRTFRWEGQAQDLPPSLGYSNLGAFLCPPEFASYLFANAADNPEYVALGEEVVRFVEDQFVIWEKPTLRWDNAAIPCVVEQYWCYHPLDLSAAVLIISWAKAYEHTGNRLYLEKAKSIANTQTVVQDQKTGKYPTRWYTDGTFSDRQWDMCATEAAVAMIEFGEFLGSLIKKQ